jgi:hypothetical protein
MDLRGCKTTKQGPLGSLSAAHSISLGVFDEFSDSLLTEFYEVRLLGILGSSRTEEGPGSFQTPAWEKAGRHQDERSHQLSTAGGARLRVSRDHCCQAPAGEQ